MMEKCEICGADAGYFTDTFDPTDEKRYTLTLCEMHQMIVCQTVLSKVREMQYRRMQC